MSNDPTNVSESHLMRSLHFIIIFLAVFLVFLTSNVGAYHHWTDVQYGLPTTDPYEPNDLFATAYGPLVSGAIYDATVDPQQDYDYYYFDVSGAGITEIIAIKPVGDANYTIQVFDKDARAIAWEGFSRSNPVHIVKNNLPIGRYYILVRWNYSSNQDPSYRLQVSAPILFTPTPTETTIPSVTPTFTATTVPSVTPTPTPSQIPASTATPTIIDPENWTTS